MVLYFFSGITSQSIFINVEKLLPGTEYIMEGHSWTPGSEITIRRHQFKVNRVPFGGTCIVNPTTGN